MKNKLVSVICILSILVSCFSFAVVQASDNALDIISASFIPYNQQISVLADVPEGYDVSMYVSGSEINCTAVQYSEYTLYSSDNFAAQNYGIVPVTLKATNGTTVLSDTENIKIVKAFSTNVSFEENFNSLEAMTMADTADASVANAVNSLDEISLSAVPTTSYAGRYADITNTYTPDSSSALTMRFQSSADKGLPTLKLDPATDGTNGIIDLSYDFYTTSPYIRQTIYPVSRAHNSNLTFVTQDGVSYASSFRVVNYETYSFGSSDKKVEVNTWYNVRFSINLNDLTFEFYVNGELINYGDFTYNNAQIGQYIYGINNFSLAAGAQAKAGASDNKPVNVTFDNLKITHTNIGASASALSYTASTESYETDITDAIVANDADSIILGFDNAITFVDGDVTLQKSDGTVVEADVLHTQGEATSAKANRSIITILPIQKLSVPGNYKIVLSKNVKFGSTAYGLDTVIPLKTSGESAFISPESGSDAELGKAVNIKAYTPDSISSDLYINDEYITTLFADDSQCVSYLYDTSGETAGEKCLKLVISKNDGTTQTLTSLINLSQSNIIDIIPLETFENEVASDYFSVVKQAGATSASMVQTQIDGRNAAAFKFVANAANKKVIQVQKSVSSIQTGRVALEFDMYIAEENKNAELSISFGDGTYTFYPLDIAKQFSGGKIGGITMPYYGWHRIKLLIDTVDQSSEIYFDGNQIGETCYTFDNTYHKVDVADPTSITGFKAFTISLWQAQSYTAGEEYLGFAVDNWHVYKEFSLPAINSVTGIEKYNDGQLIPYDTGSFELEITNAEYVDTQSLADNFSLISDDKFITTKNLKFADGILTFDVDSLPQYAELKFVLGKNTLLHNGSDIIGKDVVYTLKTADSNGLYIKKTINVHDSETNVIFTVGAIEERNVCLVVASYLYNKLASATMQNVTVKDIENIPYTVSNDGITTVKAFVWSSQESLVPLTQNSYASVGNSNPLGLNSVFESDSVALSYIGDAVVLKDDIDSVVYNQQKYKYEELTDSYPYTSSNGTFMISSDLFSKIFGTQITADGNTVKVGTYADGSVGSSSITKNGTQIILDNPLELKNGTVYVPVRSIAQDILGKTYMYDRGMHIFDDEEFKYTNSVSTYETKEPIDSVYRLMQFEHKKSTDIYNMMESHLGGNVHPRILTDKASLEKIKANSLTDPVVAEALANTISEADSHLTSDVQVYDIPDGIRLLTAARNVMERLVTLSAAYLVTEDTKYADRAWTELESCFAWPDWNTDKHYLDNSELLYGVSVAFDSFYDYYTDEQKKTILDKTWELSLKHTADRYQGINFSGSEWRTARSNWGFVCNGAVVTAILTFGLEEEYRYQPYYDYLLDCALQAVEYPLMLYYPDGAWEEGLAYWEYSLRYLTTSLLVPLYYSTGSTLDFMKPEGVSKLANMGLYMQSGNFAFNFSDNGSENKRPCESVYAFAMLTNDDDLMQTWNYEMDSMSANHAARTLMWYRPSESGNQSSASSLSLDSFFRGVEVGSMKQQWYNADGSVVFFKGGQNNTGTHLDTGTFCFDTMGKRWSVDPGKDSYNIEGGYNGLAGCELYVKRPEGHNCVVINPRSDVENEYYGGQYVYGRAEITDMQSSAQSAFSTVDLSDTYKYDTNSYTRGFYLGDNRRTLVVQDEINLKEANSSLYWFMHTRATITLDADGKGAYLTQGTKKLRVDMLTNADDAKFVINSVGPDVQRFPTDPIREGQLIGGSFTNIKVLTLEATGSGNVYITVKLTPVDDAFDSYSDISYVPVKDWTLE